MLLLLFKLQCSLEEWCEYYKVALLKRSNVIWNWRMEFYVTTDVKPNSSLKHIFHTIFFFRHNAEQWSIMFLNVLYRMMQNNLPVSSFHTCENYRWILKAGTRCRFVSFQIKRYHSDEIWLFFEDTKENILINPHILVPKTSHKTCKAAFFRKSYRFFFS